MYITGKNIYHCIRKNCVSKKSPNQRVGFEGGICSHCCQRDEELEQELKDFELTGIGKETTKQIKVFRESELRERKRQEQRKEDKKKAQQQRKYEKRLQYKNKASKKRKSIKVKNYKQDESKQKEYAAMLEYWNMRADEMGGCVCEESGVYIPEFHIGNVHHILGKGANKAAADDIENLCILSAAAHKQAHDDMSKMKLYLSLIHI